MNQRAPGSGGAGPSAPAEDPEAREAAEAAKSEAGEVAGTARERSGEVADRAREQGRQVADTAKDETADLTATTREETREVVETARSEAAQVADEATAQVKALVDDTFDGLHEQARAQTHRAAGALHVTGDQLRALADGRPEDAGDLDEYARKAATQVDRVADRVDEMGFDGLVDEVQGFARRRPTAFLAGAAATGFLVGRLGRNRVSGDGR